MKITNVFNLPQPFVSMAQSDYQYTEGRYSATSLLKGIKEMMLERRHNNEIEMDVSDMIWLLFGKAVHLILEQSEEGEHQFKEVKLAEEINGRTISGIFDLYDAETQTIEEYKTCSAWKFVYKNFDDWKTQLRIYAYLLEKAGFPVRYGRVNAMIKDFSKTEAKRNADYPQKDFQKVEFSISPEDIKDIEIDLFLRIEKIKKFENVPDDYIPPCTKEERWNSGDKFAVMKVGRKSALRVLESKESAEQWISGNVKEADLKKVSIKKRPGEDRKCQDYCRANQFCHYWKRRQKIDQIKLERGSEE